MSTMFFGKESLANLGAALLDPRWDSAREFAEHLVAYATDNARAFNLAYRHREANKVAPTVEEMVEAIKARAFRASAKDAIDVVRLLRYNLDDCATVPSLEACSFFMGRAIDRLRGE